MPAELQFLDSNVFLRFLTQDHPEHSVAVLPLFRQLGQGTVSATTSESILVEVVQVLSSRSLYNLARAEVRRHLRVILGLQGLRLSGKRMYRRALDLSVSHNVDFVDALTAAQTESRGITTIWSFDRDFDRFHSVHREEPTAPPGGASSP